MQSSPCIILHSHRPSLPHALLPARGLVRDRRAQASGEPEHFVVHSSRGLQDRPARRQNWIAEFALPLIPGGRQCYWNPPVAPLQTDLRHSSRLLVAGKRGRATIAPAFDWVPASDSLLAHPALPANFRTSPWPRPIRTRRSNHLGEL